MNKIMKYALLSAMMVSLGSCSDFFGGESENSGVRNGVL